MSLNLTTTGRNGALRTYRITGIPDELTQIAEPARRAAGYAPTLNADSLTGSASRSGLDALSHLVTQHNADQAREHNASQTAPERVLVVAGSVRVGSEINGLLVASLGREWRYSERDHESRGCAAPHLIGERVQYAYFN